MKEGDHGFSGSHLEQVEPAGTSDEERKEVRSRQNFEPRRLKVNVFT